MTPYVPPSPSSARPRRGRRVVLGDANSDVELSARPATAATSRLMSAAEVAKSVKHFETWAIHQPCEQAAFSDLPHEMKVDVAEVFNLTRRIPKSWINENRTSSIQLGTLFPQLVEFLRRAYDVCPELFSDDIKYNPQDTHELFEELTTVRLAWKRLQSMRRSGLKWSEADYAANVYNMFRSPAIHRSAYRYQCSISLPQPQETPSGDAHRVLCPKNAIPDCVTFIKASSIRQLFTSVKSPYKLLSAHPPILRLSHTHLEHTFRFQASPCTQPPDNPCFEFVSSVWEDKKPAHELLEQAYRQNRMSTAAAVRMLYSLRIHLCIFGLVWAEGTVRAHVDWCTDDKGYPTILSAPYPGLNEDDGPTFHEWNLDQPSDLLQVYFLLRNIDVWTAGQFRQKVIQGVEAFSRNVLAGEQEYSPWKRVVNVRLPRIIEGQENVPIGSGSQRRFTHRNR